MLHSSRGLTHGPTSTTPALSSTCPKPSKWMTSSGCQSGAELLKPTLVTSFSHPSLRAPCRRINPRGRQTRVCTMGKSTALVSSFTRAVTSFASASPQKSPLKARSWLATPSNVPPISGWTSRTQSVWNGMNTRSGNQLNFFSLSFLCKIIDFPDGQINDPLLGKCFSLLFLPVPATPSLPAGTLEGLLS